MPCTRDPRRRRRGPPPIAFTVRGLGWMVLAVVLPLVFPDGAVAAGAGGGCGSPRGTSVLFVAMLPLQPETHRRPGPGRRQPARACRRTCGRSPSWVHLVVVALGAAAWSPGWSPSPGGGGTAPRWSVSRSAGSPWACWSRWPGSRSWRPGVLGGAGVSRWPSPRCPSRSGSPSCSTGSTRSTSWSTGRCSTRCSPRRWSRSTCSSSAGWARCSTPAAPAGCRCWPRPWWPSGSSRCARRLQRRRQPADLRRLARTACAGARPQHPARAGGQPRPGAGRRPGRRPRRPAAGVTGGADAGRRRPRRGRLPDRRRPDAAAGARGHRRRDPGRRRRLGPAAGRGGPRRAGRGAGAGGPGDPAARRPAPLAGAAGASPARRSGVGSGATCTTGWAPRWPGSP